MTVAEKIVAQDAVTIAESPLDWGELKGKTVLISGANGYVPQYLVHGLLKRNDLYQDGIKVVALCRNRERAYGRFSAYLGRKDFELILQDVCASVSCGGPVDYIIHGASPADKKSWQEDALAVYEANVTGCRNLLGLAREKQAVFMLISSVDVYGKFPGEERLTEDRHGELDLLDTANVYACAKRASETLCACHSRSGVSCKIVRPFQILAGGIRPDDGRLHINFISQMLEKNEIVLRGDGTPRRSFLYVTDAITGMLTVLLKGKSGEAYNLCMEEGEASVLELAQLMAARVTDRTIRIAYNMETRATDPAVTRAISVVCGDSGKLRSLGWKPEVSLPVACRRMMTYYGVTEEE